MPAVSKSTVPTWRIRCEERLVRVHVLHALHARLLRPLGEQAAADVQPLRREHVPRRHALDEAGDDQHAEHDDAEQDAEPPARDEDADDQRDDRDADAAQVEGQQRPPRRVPLEHDLLAGMQVHAANATRPACELVFVLWIGTGWRRNSGSGGRWRRSPPKSGATRARSRTGSTSTASSRPTQRGARRGAPSTAKNSSRSSSRAAACVRSRPRSVAAPARSATGSADTA